MISQPTVRSVETLALRGHEHKINSTRSDSVAIDHTILQMTICLRYGRLYATDDCTLQMTIRCDRTYAAVEYTLRMTNMLQLTIRRFWTRSHDGLQRKEQPIQSCDPRLNASCRASDPKQELFSTLRIAAAERSMRPPRTAASVLLFPRSIVILMRLLLLSPSISLVVESGDSPSLGLDACSVACAKCLLSFAEPPRSRCAPSLNLSASSNDIYNENCLLGRPLSCLCISVESLHGWPWSTPLRQCVTC